MLPLADFVVLLDKGKVAFAGKPMNYVSEHTSSDSTIDKVSSQNEKPSSSGSLSRADGLDKPMESNSQQPTVDPCQPSQEATEETRTNDSTVTLKSGEQ